MMKKTVKGQTQFILPEIRSFHPKTGEPLCVVTPGTGSVFDVKLPEDINREKLVVVVSDLAEFHYKSTMAVQRRLMKMGWTHEVIKELFFPEAEVKGGPPTGLHGGSIPTEQLHNMVLQALGTSARFAKLVQDLPIDAYEAGAVNFDGWTPADYTTVLAWARDDGDDDGEVPERVQQYVGQLLSAIKDDVMSGIKDKV